MEAENVKISEFNQQQTKCSIMFVHKNRLIKDSLFAIDEEDTHYGMFLVVALALLTAVQCAAADNFLLCLNINSIYDIRNHPFKQFYTDFLAYYVMGQITGAAICKYIVRKVGPKNCLTISSASFVVGWVLLSFYRTQVDMIYVVRYLNGCSCALTTVSLLIYLYEISTVKHRSSILGFYTIATIIGHYIPFLIRKQDAYVKFSLLFTLCTFALQIWLPESPVWLLQYHKDLRKRFIAETALKQLRSGNKNPNYTTEEINRMIRQRVLTNSVQLDQRWFYLPLIMCFLLTLLMHCALFQPLNQFAQSIPIVLLYFEINITRTYYETHLLPDLPTNPIFFGVITAIELIASLLVMLYLLRRFRRSTILFISGIVLVVLYIAIGSMLQQQLRGMRRHVDCEESLIKDLKRDPKSSSFLLYHEMCQILSSVIYSIHHTVAWTLIVEIPVIKFRTYTISCCWILEWILNYLQNSLIQSSPLRYYALYYISVIILIPILLVIHFIVDNIRAQIDHEFQ